MKLAIFAQTFSANSVSELFAKIKEQQLEYVDYNMACSGLSELPHEVPIPSIDEIVSAAHTHDLHITGLSATFNMIHPNPAVREEGLQALETLAATARAIGTNLLSLCTGSRDPQNQWRWHPENASPDAWRDLQQTMERAIQIAETHEVLLGIEPETGNVIRSPALARKFLDEMQSDRLQIILDPANLFDEADSTAQINGFIDHALELLHEDIGFAHAKDRSLTGKVQAAGKGAVDFGYFVKQLRAIGFDGPLIIHGLAEEEVPETRSYLASF